MFLNAVLLIPDILVFYYLVVSLFRICLKNSRQNVYKTGLIYIGGWAWLAGSGGPWAYISSPPASI